MKDLKMNEASTSRPIGRILIWMGSSLGAFWFSFIIYAFSSSGYSRLNITEVLQLALNSHFPVGVGLGALQAFLLVPWFGSRYGRLLAWWCLTTFGWTGIWIMFTLNYTMPLMGSTLGFLSIICCSLLVTVWPLLSFPRIQSVSIFLMPYLALFGFPFIPDASFALGILWTILSAFIFTVISRQDE